MRAEVGADGGYDAKACFSEIVDKAIKGEEFVVTRMGRPAVRVLRYEGRRRVSRLGDLAGRIRIADDFDGWPPDLCESLGISESS